MDDYKLSIGGKVVLITGGAGSIGSNLTRVIGELGAKTVIVLDDLSAAYEWNIPALPNVLFVKGSVEASVCREAGSRLPPGSIFCEPELRRLSRA